VQQGGAGGGGQIILLGDRARAGLGRRVLHALLSQTPVPPVLESLSDYPRWLVVLCVTIVLAAAIWVVMKLLKWTLWLLVLAVLVIGLGTAGWMLLR